MASLIPRAIADVELQLASAVAVGSTSFTLSSANDDDGNALPAGIYCFTIDSGTSNKEYLIGQVNGTAVTSVKTVTRQGVETSGAVRAHRVGAPCIVTNFATLQRVADILRGQLDLDGSTPIGYDAEPTLTDREQIATVGYVIDTAAGGTVAFDSQVIAGVGGESIVAGNLVYFKTSDQEWYLTDADTAATVEGVQLGIALGTGSDGVPVAGGIQISGTYTTTGLTAGSLYYAGNTAGAISASAGTIKQVIGIALSTTKLLLIPRNPQNTSTRQKDALAGGGDFGTPSGTNKFVTEEFLFSDETVPVVRTYLNAGSPHTWTRPEGLKYVIVEVQAGGGGGGGATDTAGLRGSGGGGGGYSKKLIEAGSLGETETVTVGAGGNGSSGGDTASTGGTSSFGTHATATGGTGGTGNHGQAGDGGVGSSGDLNLYGQRGQASVASGPLGDGGHSFLGGTVVGNGSTSVNGNTGRIYGGGGGGGGRNATGGAGAPGIVIVTEHYS
jgi:hypothetical protein